MRKESLCLSLVVASLGANAVAQTPRVVWSRAAHYPIATAVRFSPDGQNLVSSGNAGTSDSVGNLKFWNVATGRNFRTIFGYGPNAESELAPQFAIDFNPSGSSFVSGGYYNGGGGGGALLIRLIRPAYQDSIQIPLGVEHLVTFPDGAIRRTIATRGRVFDNDVSPDGKLYADAEESNPTLSIREYSTGRVLKTIATGHKFGITAVEFSPNSQYVATGGYDSKVKIWRVSDKALILTIQPPVTESVFGIGAVNWSPDGRLVGFTIDGYGDGAGASIRLFRVPEKTQVKKIEAPQYFNSRADFTPDGRYWVVASSEWDEGGLDRVRVRFIRTTDGSVDYTYTITDIRQGSDTIDIDVSPDNQRFALALSNGRVVVYKLPYAP